MKQGQLELKKRIIAGQKGKGNKTSVPSCFGNHPLEDLVCRCIHAKECLRIAKDKLNIILDEGSEGNE